MFNEKFRKYWVILGVVVLATAFFVIFQYNQAQKNKTVAVAGEKVIGDIQQNEAQVEELLIEDTTSDKTKANVILADNGYFRARVGTYWIYEGQGSRLKDNYEVDDNGEAIDYATNYKIKLKNEVVSVSGTEGDYLLKIKTTNLIDESITDGTITLKNDYVLFKYDSFYNYVKFPLKVNSRWAEGPDSDPAEKLRDDGFYQNRINYELKEKALGNDCYNIVQQTLSDKTETIWCENIGPIQNSYHHNGSLDDSSIGLVKYHF